VAATDGSSTDNVTITWNKSTGATDYQVYRDASPLGWIGDVATYDDTGADAPTITPGTANATDGDFVAYVALSLAGESANNGTTHTYKVRARNATGESADSATDTGYRGVGAFTYQWMRSAADSDANYSNIAGGTTDPYNDTGAPADGSGRYYKCTGSATGAASANSTVDRGFRGTLAAPTVTTDNASSVEETTATLNGEITATGGDNATDRGFQWDIDSGSPYADNWTENGNFGTGVFNHGITALTKGELYYYIAGANNTVGWGWGSEITFLTKPDEPSSFIATAGEEMVSLSWANGTGTDNTTVRGKIGSYPTDYNDGTLIYNGTGTSANHTGLTGGDHWYYGGWSWCSEGGREQWSDVSGQDDATPYTNPTVQTDNATGVTSSSATLNAQITSTGGQNADTRGFQWGLSSGNYTDNWTEVGSFGTGSFSHAISGLPENTTCYYRGITYNDGGWGYGGEISFSTSSADLGAPTNFTLTRVTVNEIQASWDVVVGATSYLLMVSTVDYPDDPGGSNAVAYSGNLTTVNVVGYDLDVSTYYFSLWAYSNPYSEDYATGSIGGTGVTLIALVFLAVGLTVAMFHTRNAMLGFPSTIMWAILGAYAYTESTTAWGDWEYFLFFASAFGMTIFCALAGYGLREKRDTIADEELEKGDGELIGKSEENPSVFTDEESKPSRRTQELRERTKRRRTRL